MCKHGETSIVCGWCDNEYVQKNDRLQILNRQIDESLFYDDPSSVIEPLWDERDRLREELQLS